MPELPVQPVGDGGVRAHQRKPGGQRLARSQARLLEGASTTDLIGSASGCSFTVRLQCVFGLISAQL